MDAAASATDGDHGRVTLADVAAAAGVSPSTASLAFSGSGPVASATRERVLATADRLGYAGPDPRARSLRRGRSGIIGVVMEDRIAEGFRDPVNIAMLDGIADAVGAAGESLLLLTDQDGDFSSLESAPADGVILVGCSTRLDRSVEVLLRRGLPVVAIEADEFAGVLPVGLDNRDATRRGAELLASLGHSRVAIVALPIDSARDMRVLEPGHQPVITNHTARERIAGARDVFPDAVVVASRGSLISAGREAARALLDVEPSARPTAIIAQSDMLAAGIVAQALELGIDVPAQLSVVGFDGVPTPEIEPHSLTTLVQPSTEKGRAAAIALLERVGGGAPEPVSFASELRIGTTTAEAARSGSAT